jgi:hypothetical protein
LVNGKLLLQGKAGPLSGYYSSSGVFSDLTRLVCGTGIYDNNFIGPGQRFAGVADVCCLIEGDNGGGDLH